MAHNTAAYRERLAHFAVNPKAWSKQKLKSHGLVLPAWDADIIDVAVFYGKLREKKIELDLKVYVPKSNIKRFNNILHAMSKVDAGSSSTKIPIRKKKL